MIIKRFSIPASNYPLRLQFRNISSSFLQLENEGRVADILDEANVNSIGFADEGDLLSMETNIFRQNLEVLAAKFWIFF